MVDIHVVLLTGQPCTALYCLCTFVAAICSTYKHVLKLVCVS
jgi:hypothetical protein